MYVPFLKLVLQHIFCTCKIGCCRPGFFTDEVSFIHLKYLQHAAFYLQ